LTKNKTSDHQLKYLNNLIILNQPEVDSYLHEKTNKSKIITFFIKILLKLMYA
jgi:hypothetical protein